MKTLLGAAALSALLLAGCQSTSDNSAADNSNNTNWNWWGEKKSTAGQTLDNSGQPMGLTGSTDISAQDKQFILKAASLGMYEVQAGQLAEQKSATDKIKQLAQTMIDDHTKVNDQLKSLAQGKGVTLPTTLNLDQQRMYDQLAKLGGTAFDSEYLRQQREGHREAVDLFQNESLWGSSSDVKQFASTTLPALQHHKDMVDAMWNVDNRSEKNRVIPEVLK